MVADTVWFNKSVYVEDGTIIGVYDAIVKEGVAEIDGQNGFLSPGLIDMHVHLWDKQELGLYLANGVTTIRNLWGFPMHLRLKKELASDELLGPMLFTSGPKLSGDDPGNDKVQVTSSERARELIRTYKERGFDFVKTYVGMDKTLAATVASQSEQSDMDVVSHPSRKIAYLDQFHPQVKSFEHAEEIVQQGLDYQLDSLGLDTIIDAFKNTETALCPTLTGYYKIIEMLEKGEGILRKEPVQFMNPLIKKMDARAQIKRWGEEKQRNPSIESEIRQQHQFHLFILKKMNDAGVNIVCGTDAGIGVTAPGLSIHQELAFYKEAGLTNYEALRTATLNPSFVHSELENLGSIEPGKIANFIWSSENPLEELSTLANPQWVMVKGQKIQRETLLSFPEEARNRNIIIATALRYGEYLFVEKH